MGLALAAAPAVALDSRLAAINDWLFVLQPEGAAALDVIAGSQFDLAVIDYSSDGSESGEFTTQEIADLRASGKLVLAYLSIGEAESYRFYWDPAWNDDPPPDPEAPAWLGPENPEFPGNYKVRYWDPDWQAVLFGSTAPAAYLDRILAQGFDGVYLDIIDAFYFWSEEVPELTREEARLEMIALVEAIAAYARSRGATDFLLVPQNGLDIVWNDAERLDAAGLGYLQTIDAVGVEDLFYDELSPQPPAETAYREAVLDDYQAAGGDSRAVVLVDYVWDDADPGGAANVARYNDFQLRALAGDYVAYAALRDRALDELLEVEASGGFLVAQPRANGLFADGFESGDTDAWDATVP